jgi:tRNA(fMet)-specific endonuclease VapC
MNYLLDTNVCIRYLNGRSLGILKRLDELPDSKVCVSSITKFELRYGALRSNFSEKIQAQQEYFLSRFVSLPFDDVAHGLAASIRADLTRAGTPIGPYDLLIAAIALSHDLILVTHNTREFSRISGLKIEDWEQDDQ